MVSAPLCGGLNCYEIAASSSSETPRSDGRLLLPTVTLHGWANSITRSHLTSKLSTKKLFFIFLSFFYPCPMGQGRTKEILQCTISMEGKSHFFFFFFQNKKLNFFSLFLQKCLIDVLLKLKMQFLPLYFMCVIFLICTWDC